MFSGIVIGNMKKSLHITLAHHYPQENHQRLEKLAQEIDLNAEVRWSLRLYSRDARLATAKVSLCEVSLFFIVLCT